MAEPTLFNINNISLLFSGFLSLVSAVLLIAPLQSRANHREPGVKRPYGLFLAAFFLLEGLRAFDMFAYWHPGVRDLLLQFSVIYFFACGVVFFLQGPLLWWFTRASRDYVMSRGELFIYWLKHSRCFSQIYPGYALRDACSAQPPQQQLVMRIRTLMAERKPYLEPHITVERLATKLNVSPKLLSGTINSQLQMNFFELIGSYRVEEAKKKLADAEYREVPISEIMKRCGFNSKSVFNQAFKKAVGVTPSHYRQQNLNNKAAL